MTAYELDPEAVELAPAKVNLFLHLRGRRPDGYHLIESLAVFPTIGDRLHVARAGAGEQGLSLEIDGPFGAALQDVADNLVLRAARALAQAEGIAPDIALRLEKHLPVASGIGGGSSDAAAALRMLSRHWNVPVPEGLALELGADVPVCLGAPESRIMTGIGDELGPAPAMPAFWMVLANPGVTVPTGVVFATLTKRELPPGPPLPTSGLPDFGALTQWLVLQRNDLQAVAVSMRPSIGNVLEALSDAPVARMSGSGTTCFALYAREAEAKAQAERLKQAEPEWWVVAAPVEGNA